MTGIVTKIALDKASQAEFQAGLAKSGQSVKQFGTQSKQTLDALNLDFQQFTAQFAKTFKQVEGKLIDLRTGKETSYQALQKFTKEVPFAPGLEVASTHLAKLTVAKKKDAQVSAEEAAEIRALNQEISDLAKFAGVSESQIENLSDADYELGRSALDAQRNIAKMNRELQEQQKSIARLRQVGNTLGQVGRPLFLGGSAVLGGIFALANSQVNKDIDEFKEGGKALDDMTKRWFIAQKRIELSYERTGKSAARALLPILEKIAGLAERASKFIEKNPEVINKILGGATAAVSIGALANILSKGIQIYAGAATIAAQAKFLLGTTAFKSSVDRFVLAATGMKTTGVGGSGGLSNALGTATFIGIGVLIAKAVTDGINAIFKRTGISQKIADAQQTIAETSRRPYPGIITKSGEDGGGFLDSLDKMKDGLFDAETELDDLTGTLSELTAESEKAGQKILRNLEQENLEAEQDYIDARSRILRSSNAALISAIRDLKQTESRIKQQLSSTLANITQSFNEANLEAERDYQEARKEAVRDSEEEIAQIRQRGMEDLRKLEEDFLLEERDLINQRDALGLKRLRENFDREKSELQRNTQREIAERRREGQIRLQELRQQHEKERAERYAKYQKELADARAQAEQELKEARESAAQRRHEIIQSRQQELSELLRSYHEERRQRILSAYQQIRDLGNAHQAEAEIRRKYQSYILQDVTRWMQSMQNVFRSASNTTAGTNRLSGGLIPTRHAGGYTERRLYQLNEGEWVATPETVKMLEKALGGSLSQGNVQTLANSSRSLTLNDHRRFNAQIPVRERRAIGDETLERAKDLLSLIGS